MTEPIEPEKPERPSSPDASARIYVDSSALAKLYLPEAESETLDAFLRGRRGLLISDLAITEVLSAVSRRKREKQLRAELANEIRDALLEDAESGSLHRVDLSPAVHREAEYLLLATESVSLRTLDALHIALALSGAATHMLTFDRRMQDAAAIAGLHIMEL